MDQLVLLFVSNDEIHNLISFLLKEAYFLNYGTQFLQNNTMKTIYSKYTIQYPINT